MKKVIFALAAVVALAACSNEETIIADKGAAIGFDTFVGKATRVDDPSYTNDNLFANFGVFGTVEGAELFNNKTVAGSGINGTWTYEGTQYWIAGAKYNFAAVAPKTVKVNDVDTDVYTNASYAVTSSVVEGEKVYTGTTTLSFNNNGKIDLLYAEATAVGQSGSGDPDAPANGKVAFTFRHILSKIKFSFENQYLSTGSTIRVYDVELYNAHSSGTATLTATSTTWSVGNDDLSIDFGDTENTTNDPTATSIVQGAEWESENARFIIPGTEKVYSVNFKVDVLYGDTVVKTYEHVATLEFTPKAGVAYDIKSTINHTNIDPAASQEPIEFTVKEVKEWNDYQPKDAIIN